MLRGALKNRIKGRESLLPFIFGALFIFTELSGLILRLHEGGHDVSLSLCTLSLFLAASFLLSFLLLPFFTGLLSCGFELRQDAGASRVSAFSGSRGRLRIFSVCWALLFISYIPCLLAFWPGLYCYDISWQWQMAISGDYFTHHPLLHTFMSGCLFEALYGIFGSYEAGLVCYCILQLLILSASLAFSLSFLWKWRIRRGIFLAALAFYAFFPFIPVLGISTTKDVIFGSLFLVVITCISDMAMSGRLYRGMKLLAFILLLTLMELFRNNGIHAVIFSAAVLLTAGALRKNRPRRLLLGLSLSFLLASGLSIAASGALKAYVSAAEGSIAEMLSVPCQQLARTYVEHGEELSEEEREELFSYIPEEGLASYKYYVSDPVKARLDGEKVSRDPEAFFSLWLRLFKKYPGTFLASFFANTMGLWYFGGDSSCYLSYDYVSMPDEDHVIREESRIPFLRSFYTWFTDENLKKSLPVISRIFYTSFYSWAVLLTAFRAIERKRTEELVPCLLCISYMLTLLLGPCITVRYMFGIIISVPILLGISFSEMKVTGIEGEKPNK